MQELLTPPVGDGVGVSKSFREMNTSVGEADNSQIGLDGDPCPFLIDLGVKTARVAKKLLYIHVYIIRTSCCYGLTENAGHEIAGHENTGHEFARNDKYRMKIDYIILECAFLLNFKSFVCKASVLMY